MRIFARRHPHATALAAYVGLASAATWPLLPRATTAIAGATSAAYRTLWGLWWWADSLGRGVSPYRCDAVRWPVGIATWLQAWDVPATLAVLPVWWAAPRAAQPAVYNAVLFCAYVLSGFTCYALAREVWGGHLAPFLTGVLYAMGAYHLGTGPGDPAVLSMVWSPLYFLALVRTVRRHGAAAPLLAGISLAAAASASPYQLAFCAIGTVVLLALWLRTDRATLVSAAFLRRMALLAFVFLALAGWLYAGMMRAAIAAPAGPGTLAEASPSIDLLAILVPGGASFWRSGPSAAELPPAGFGGVHIGFVLCALATFGALRARAARPWLAVALIGFVLALGPRLHVGGRDWDLLLLPFGWLERLVPLQRFGASPARFAWLLAFGTAIAAGAALSHIVRGGRRGPVLATVIVALAVVEGWPRAMPMAGWPAPRFLRDLASDGERWAVLDLTTPSRQLWHQLLHRHPQVGDPLNAPSAPLQGANRRLAGAVGASSLVAHGTTVSAQQGAIRDLAQMNVRFVVTDAATVAAVRPLRLARAYDGDGIVVFELPPAIQMASSRPPR